MTFKTETALKIKYTLILYEKYVSDTTRRYEKIKIELLPSNYYQIPSV